MLRFFFVLTLTASVMSGCTKAPEPKRDNTIYSPETKYLIIHSDDAGMCHSTNVATSKAFEAGAITSSSCMVPCPWFPEWAAYARQHPEKDYGIHLTLNAEHLGYKWGPVAGKNVVPSLCDRQGYLLKSAQELMGTAKAHEVEIELRAQIDRANQFGMNITHLDAHIHAVLRRPDLAEIYVNLAIEYDIPALITPGYLEPENVSDWVGLGHGNGEMLLEAMAREGLPILDSSTMMYTEYTVETRTEYYRTFLRDLTPGFHQLVVHCGVGDEELKSITGNWNVRDTDLNALLDPEFRQEIKDLGIELISYKELRTLNDQRRKLEQQQPAVAQGS